MRTFFFYLLIAAPLFLLALLSKLGALDARSFTCLLLLYVVVYHPTVVGQRLLSKHVIAKKDFVKTYIPLWNMRYFNQAFF
jgi:hypothetical protein